MSYSVILHIGTDKTGTSSIQEFLYQNKSRLASSGIQYLHMPGRVEYRDLPAYCMDLDRYDAYFRKRLIDTHAKRLNFNEEFLAEFHRLMLGVPPETHTVIISSEHLWARLISEDEVSRLKSLIAIYATDVKIVCYLRDQSDKVVSNYSTFIKSGGTIGFKQHLAGFILSGRNDYDLQVKIWESVFDRQNIVLRVFDKRSFHGGSLLSDFTQAAFDSLVENLEVRVSNKNISLSRLGIQLARLVNILVPNYSPIKGVNRYNRRVMRVIEKYFTGRLSLLSENDRALLLSHYKESNERIRKEYFPERKSLF